MQLPEQLTIDTKYTLLIVQKFALTALIVGALNWLFIGLFDMNLITGIFGQNLFSKLLFVLVGLSALFLMFNRNFYLPFLGESVVPCGAFEDKVPSGADTSVSVHVAPGAKILYWAAEPEAEQLKDINDWKKAYASFTNIGMTTADNDGNAILKVRKPQSYTVPFKGKLDPHIHYRVCGQDGMMAQVNTVYITNTDTSSVEGFTGAIDVSTQINPEKLISEFRKDPKKFINQITSALPHVTEAMNALNNQFIMNAHGGAEAHEQQQQLDGGNLSEAFRNY